MMMFAWNSVEVVFNESVVNAIFGVLAFTTYVAYFIFDLGKKCVSFVDRDSLLVY